MKAKQALLTGIEKFPKNERILDGLMQLYTSEEGVGDPADLVALIDKAIADNPSNVDLWFGRGRIFYALKDYDKSIESFEKVVELKPDLFEGNYYLGVFYTIKGDELNKVMNEKQYSSQAAYDARSEDRQRGLSWPLVPWFEKAHEIKPEDVDTLEFLKSLCFRLRDEPGVMDKYNTYNAPLQAGPRVSNSRFEIQCPGKPGSTLWGIGLPGLQTGFRGCGTLQGARGIYPLPADLKRGTALETLR